MRAVLSRRPSPAMIVALIALVLGAAGGALAGRGGGHKTFVKGAATSKGFGNDLTTPAFTSNATSRVPIPDAKLTLRTPRKALVVATFNGSSQCYATPAAGACEILIKIDGTVAKPKHQGPFDSVTENDNPNGEALSMTVDRQVGAGSHTIRAFYRGRFGTPTVFLNSWHLFAQAMPR